MEKSFFFFQGSSKFIRISEIYVFLDVYDAVIAKYFPYFQIITVPSFWFSRSYHNSKPKTDIILFLQ